HVTRTGGDRGCAWRFPPAEAFSPRAVFRAAPAGYTGNPPPVLSTDHGVHVVTQPLVAGGRAGGAYNEAGRAHGGGAALRRRGGGAGAARAPLVPGHVGGAACGGRGPVGRAPVGRRAAAHPPA